MMRRAVPASKRARPEAWLVRVARVVAWVLGSLYGLQLVGRVVFVIVEGGMERSDGMGSPLAFVIGMVFEFIFLGIPALALAGFVRWQTTKLEPTSGAKGRTVHMIRL